MMVAMLCVLAIGMWFSYNHGVSNGKQQGWDLARSLPCVRQLPPQV